MQRKCVLKNCVKVFPEGGGFVNITDPEGGPTATGMIPEGGTTEKKLPSTPPPLHRLINGTALTSLLPGARLCHRLKTSYPESDW